MNYIDIKSRRPRALEKHTLADQIRLNMSLKEETIKLENLERHLEILETAKLHPEKITLGQLDDINGIAETLNLSEI